MRLAHRCCGRVSSEAGLFPVLGDGFTELNGSRRAHARHTTTRGDHRVPRARRPPRGSPRTPPARPRSGCGARTCSDGMSRQDWLAQPRRVTARCMQAGDVMWSSNPSSPTKVSRKQRTACPAITTSRACGRGVERGEAPRERRARGGARVGCRRAGSWAAVRERRLQSGRYNSILGL